ncbi:MAG: GNAT family N-acetyltransferase [Alphaproteobacteria bacterium]|nr:GNAT family N-acetyltransferase [Alphaproteobacteria bacterium]
MLKNLVHLHSLCFPNKNWTDKDFTELQKSGAEIIASENGFIVWRCTGDECEIITIGVRPDARSTGIADAMIHIMEKENTGKKIFLDVAADNIAAQKLYKKNGYKIIAVRPKYYDGKTDAHVMEKQL